MCDEKLLYIAKLIRDGNTSGYHPYWNLEATYDVLSDEEACEYIASLVEQGFTGGYYPTWSIEVEN